LREFCAALAAPAAVMDQAAAVRARLCAAQRQNRKNRSNNLSISEEYYYN